MAIFRGGIETNKCRHGAQRNPPSCHVEACEAWNQIPHDDPRHFFGRQSSGAAANQLAKDPLAYSRMKERARKAGIIQF